VRVERHRIERLQRSKWSIQNYNGNITTTKTSYHLYPSTKRLIYPCTHLSFWLNNSLLDYHCSFRQQHLRFSDWLTVEVASLYLFETILFTTSAVWFNFIKRSQRNAKIIRELLGRITVLIQQSSYHKCLELTSQAIEKRIHQSKRCCWKSNEISPASEPTTVR
jgi:hypothetical protein